MPVGYAVTVAILGAWTLCALWPVRRGRGRTTAYLVVMTFNEVPFLAIMWAVAATLLALTQGDLRTPLGLVTLAVLAPVLAALGWMLARAFHASDVPERAMTTGLGPRWRADITPALSGGLRRRVPLAKVLLAPFLRRRIVVERIPDLRYADGGREHLLDVYRHRSHPSGCPVLVHFHGGHFVSGAKNRESLPLLYRLASRGWVCISANYRLGPKAGFPDYVVDAKRVLAWVRSHGPDYGADAGTLFVAGNSAGGYLAAFTALTPNQPEYQPGFTEADTSVSAAIGLYGYYGRTDATQPASSPAAHVGDHAPPFLLMHGDADSVIPVVWSEDFTRALREGSKQPVVYTELPGAQHSFDYLDSSRGRLAVDQIEAFAAWVRSREQSPVP
jgi:acetyl esterase/lipase